MTEIQNHKPKYDLEDRTLAFARRVRFFVKQLPRTTSNFEDIKQIVRSSGSVGANYREANESLTKKDFLLRMKIARKEAKETIYWLQLLDYADSQKEEHTFLMKESSELLKIFSAIIVKSGL